MESCIFRTESGSRCTSKNFLKEVEFRHPTYKDLNIRLFLCQNHFGIVFGNQVLTVDHQLPLEEEVWLLSRYKRERDHYKKELEDVIEKVRAGVGLEYFDLANWKKMRYQRVDHAYQRYNELSRKLCRFEWCKKKLTNWKNMYVIRVYPKNQRDYVNLLFCSINHWEVFKKRIGVTGLIGSLNPENKNKMLQAGGLEKYIDSN